MRVRIASAGTGKTTSLIVRMLEAIDEGLPLRRIAAVTFTRAAAAELRDRLALALRDARAGAGFVADLPPRDPLVRAERFAEAERELAGAALTTIHGFLARALRLVAPALALDPAFVRIDEGEAAAAFADAWRSVALLADEAPTDPRLPPDRGAAAAAAWFAGRSLAATFTPADPAAVALAPLYEAAVAATRARLGPAALAPGDVERAAFRLFDAPTLVARVIERTPLVLIDEFQDVNPLQGELLERLERAGARIEIVGDPKQAIYGFRHADVAVFRRVAARAHAEGTLDPPLVRTRRHAARIAGFLAHLTATLAERGWGFAADEAPPVTPAPPAPEVPGAIEIHWWRDEDVTLSALRRSEFAGLARRLVTAHAQGRPWREMAVIARSHRSLAAIARALRTEGVPVVLGRGRGFHEQRELRDLALALRAALEPRGLPFAAFLHGPFAGLDPATAGAVASADDPLAALRGAAPEVARAFEALRSRLAHDPAGAVAHLTSAPLADGAPFLARSSPAARDNVAAWIVDLARRPPTDLVRLHADLLEVARTSDVGAVPPAGDGVALLTVHAAKGLEWPLVVVADAGAAQKSFDAPLLVESGTGAVALPGSPAFAALDAARRRRDADEVQRMLYVAVSRAREVLWITGSRGRGSAGPWLRALQAAGCGPDGHRVPLDGVSVAVHAPTRTPAPGPPDAAPRPLAPIAPWAATPRARPPYPPVVSPSWVALEGAGRSGEPRVRADFPPFHDDTDAAVDAHRGSDAFSRPLSGRSTAIGVLVHDALARRLRADDVAELALQGVMSPFPPEEHGAMLAEVAELVGAFWALVARGDLPSPGAPQVDDTELAFAFEAGGSVWQGVIDRLTRVGERFVVDDYKTDRALVPERYLVPLATYVEAVAAVHGVRPIARLVDLRAQRVLAIDDDRLRVAWQRVLAGRAP